MSQDMGHQIELSIYSGLCCCWITTGCYSGLSSYSRSKLNPVLGKTAGGGTLFHTSYKLDTLVISSLLGW